MTRMGRIQQPSLIYFPWDNNLLRLQSNEIDNIFSKEQQLIDDMLKLMYQHNGIGLAAIQVGVDKQLFVMDISESRNEPQIFINPKIISESEEQIDIEEGCLSIPETRYRIPRSKEVTVQALDREGDNFEKTYCDLAAICVQHELDHLNGILFIDYLSRLKRERIKKRLLKQGKPES